MQDNDYEKYKEMQKKMESIADKFIENCKSNELTLKEMDILSRMIPERIKKAIDEATYKVRLL